METLQGWPQAKGGSAINADVYLKSAFGMKPSWPDFRPSTSSRSQNVDARDKPGHDDLFVTDANKELSRTGRIKET
jgi:hypothetical protein